ncbi:alpha/beta hydrolase [Corynebacterium freiburgense]|uniref:alpha/beta hydrolase n=1 Tax=Corynebacterium freiburgense TaxID=556548 RepID=UPI00040D9BC1|nr:alpha/beta hydrolase family protein [Corynebacterium freiburgense]WJZ01508.1 Diacylglycerol acyltransferase/mycolyltransferase Ag85A precursor [Corynebacterium freiburgense]
MNLARRLAAPVSALVLATSALLSASPAAAAELTPAQVAGDIPLATINPNARTDVEEPQWRSKVAGRDDVREVWAFSPSMQRDVPFVVIPAHGPDRPTIYLLNGADGGEGVANWIMQTDVVDFYRSKDVNVVIPMSGKFSYYTDWVEEVPSLGGKQNWETFLTKELPGPMEGYLKANNKRAIVGMSMTGTTSLLYAQHHQGFYDAVGSFSGCAATSRGTAVWYLDETLKRGNVSREQMWGPLGTGNWHYNDALINAEKLRGTEVYVSNGSGMSGEYDMLSNPRLNNNSLAQANVKILGGAIEAATNQCTHDLKAKMDQVGVPGDFKFRPTGTHSWGYWEEDLRTSWPTFERAFNR